MLALRPNCELCDVDLPPDAPDARICSYECTFCASCVESILKNVCPNYGGGFVPRPIRPKTARREGVSLLHHPCASERVHTPYSREEITQFSEMIKDIPVNKR